MIELKKLIDIFNYASEQNKKKYYEMTCDLAKKFDEDFFDPYLHSYKSTDTIMPITRYLDENIPLFIFFSFYKGYEDSTIDIKLYFKDMLDNVANYIFDHYTDEILPSIYGFLLDSGNNKRNRFREFSSSFITCDPVKMFRSSYVSANFTYQVTFMRYYIDLLKSIVSIHKSSSITDNKIILSPNDMENIYLDILQYCKLNNYRKDIDVIYFQFMDIIKTCGLRDILEDMLNTNSSIISTMGKMTNEYLIEKIGNLIFGCMKTKSSKYQIKSALLDIMRKVQNKYIYNNDLLSIRKICLKYIASSSEYDYICYRYLTGNETDGNFLYAVRELYEDSDHNEDIIDIMKDCFVKI